jgi:hypothetical protein
VRCHLPTQSDRTARRWPKQRRLVNDWRSVRSANQALYHSSGGVEVEESIEKEIENFLAEGSLSPD